MIDDETTVLGSAGPMANTVTTIPGYSLRLPALGRNSIAQVPYRYLEKVMERPWWAIRCTYSEAGRQMESSLQTWQDSKFRVSLLYLEIRFSKPV